MGYTARQKSFIDQYSQEYLNSLGITRADLRENSERGLTFREDYNKALAARIAANPQIFAVDQIEVAQVIRVTPIRELENYSFGDAAEVFFSESASQANRINPFSALNLNKTYLIAGVVIVTIAGVVSYKITPKIPVK